VPVFLRMSGKAPAEDRIVRVTTNALALYNDPVMDGQAGVAEVSLYRPHEGPIRQVAGAGGREGPLPQA
jgi:hypothetical protein